MGQVLRAKGTNRIAPAIIVAGSGTSVSRSLIAPRRTPLQRKMESRDGNQGDHRWTTWRESWRRVCSQAYGFFETSNSNNQAIRSRTALTTRTS